VHMHSTPCVYSLSEGSLYLFVAAFNVGSHPLLTMHSPITKFSLLDSDMHHPIHDVSLCAVGSHDASLMASMFSYDRRTSPSRHDIHY